MKDIAFATNSDFLITRSLQPNVVDHRYESNNLRYESNNQRFSPKDAKIKELKGLNSFIFKLTS